jgi:hypothetical protein
MFCLAAIGPTSRHQFRASGSAGLRTASKETIMKAAESWHLLAERAASESDAARRDFVQLVLRHIVSEVGGDLDATMATLSDDPEYRVWGITDHDGPRGRTAVRAMYEAQVGIGKNRLEFHVERILVDDDAVVTEGLFRHAYPGAQLVADGLVAAGEVEPAERYLVEYRALIVWVKGPNGLIAREDTYKGTPTRVVRRLQPDEMAHLGLSPSEVAKLGFR